MPNNSLAERPPVVQVDRQPVVRFDHVTKTYDDGGVQVEAVRGVSFAVAPRRFTMIVGPSGSGKTTLLSILGCILTPTSGTLSVAGNATAGLTPEQLAALRRRYIGFIFQSYNLFPTLTAEQNVRIALDLRGERGSEATVRAQRALQQVGLRHRMKSFPSNLSGGEQQRVAVARALVGAPAVLLADEPTAALDSENGIAVMQLLAEIAKDTSRAVLAVTHDPRTVPFATRVLRIEDGLIVGEERRAEGVETVHQLARNRKRKANA